MRKKLLSTHIAVILGSSLSLPTLAQTSDYTARGGLEEIVVTARKREETLQDAPLTVSAISQERIEKFDVTSLEKIASLSPQFFVGRSSNGSGAQMTLRGIGSSSTSIGIEQSVAVILDGVYFGQGRVLNEGMFDLAQIELLKGPQSLFFGKNATAGVISLTTAKPTEEFEATARAGYEFESEQTRVEGIISGPLSETVGARLAVRHSDMDGGYFENQSTVQPYAAYDVATGNVTEDVSPADNRDAPGEEETLARLTITVDPGENLAMTFSASSTKTEVNNSSWNYTHFNCPGGVGGINPNVRCGDDFVITQNYMPSVLANSLPYARSNGELFNEYESYALTANIEYNFENYTLTSVTNYQDNKNTFGLSGDFQSIPTATFATEKNTWEAFSEELRLTSEFSGPFNFMLGILYQETERQFDQWVATAGLMNSAAPSPDLVHVASQKSSFTDGKTISPFFQVNYDFTEDLELSIGARYTDETKESEFVHPYNNPGLGGIWRTNEVAIGDQSFEEWSPEATLSWQINENVMGYVSYKTAYKSGGFSNSGIYSADFMGGSESDFTFDPETAQGFEAGIKTTLLDNQLRMNFTVYNYDYDDLQVDFFNSPTFAFITLNAGSANTTGVEMDLEYAPYAVPGLSIRTTLAYNKAEYDDFVAPCWAGQSASQGCTDVVPGTNGTPGQDISGEPTAMAPEWSASLGISYDGFLSNGWEYGIAVDSVYSDSYNASAFANPHAMRDSYTTVDASVYLAGQDQKWQLQLLGKNLTNEFIVSGVVDGPSTPGAGGAFADQMGFTSLPRTVAVQLTYKFQ
ncbi:TonB-dependent receptor [Aestuariicella hydrocarbonica]|uniref:TonB-dependent receptor n=1 Tax=Pseudomaricurvus hydrocarbonicus TaxID=1470433 RepID=A0A9E5MMB9_9GAMM|nr:TonB-dependent receptor [Aestuariicella hydrocarbonica]NHO66863.1 TonB-dependent receptor [Aestuariicella hydrocarbonica]